MQINQSSWFLQYLLSQRLKPPRWKITHSVKYTELKLHNLWDYLERKKDPHSPTKCGVGFSVSVYISCYTKVKTKDLLHNLLSFNQRLIHPQNTHTPYEYEVALFFKILKIKRHQYPFIYVLEVSYNHH